MPQNDPNQSKFFGPKKGLNVAESPLKRALPSGPNAGAPEFATQFTNFYIDPNDGVMKLRPGFAVINKNITMTGVGELGIERFNNYNEKGDAEPILVALGRSNSHKIRKGRIKITSDSGNKSLTLLFHPTSGLYEVVIKDTDTDVELNRLSLGNIDIAALDAALPGLTIDFDADLYTDDVYDGTTQLSNIFPVVDLIINENSSNELHFDDVEEIEMCMDLSNVPINNATSTVAVFSEINNVLYITLPDTPILKYSGNCISKAGLPDPDVVSKSNIIITNDAATRSQAEYDTFPLWVSENFAETENDTGTDRVDVIKSFHKDKGVTNNEASIYALAYEKDSILSAAVGSTDNQNLILTSQYSNDPIDYLDQTILGSQNITPVASPVGYTPGSFILNDYENISEVEVLNLKTDSGYEVLGAQLGGSGWVYEGANDLFTAGTSISFPVVQHNLSEFNVGDKASFRLRVVTKELAFRPDNDIGFDKSDYTFTHYDYVVKSEILSIQSATSIELSKELELYLQPGGLEGDFRKVNYDNLITNLFTTEDLEDIAIIIPQASGLSIDTYINLYRSDDVTADGDSIESAYTTEDYPVASFNLVTQIPNNPFEDIQTFYDWYDYEQLGDLYTWVNDVGVTNNSEEDLIDHTSLPKGRIITSHQGRLYISADPDSINTVYATSIVYGPEVFDATGDESFEIRDNIGDFITGLAPLGSNLAVLKSNSTHIVQGDFATGNIRRDIINSEGFGCLSHHSISQVKDGIAYLSQEGVVYWQYDSKPQMMGSIHLNREAGSEPMSRIRGLIKDPSLDLTRAISFNDFQKELYVLYIPKTTEQHAGLTGVSSNGLTLVYDYMNDMWFEYKNYEFRSGAVYVDGTLYRSNSIGTGTDIDGQVVEREWQTKTLYDYQDEYEQIEHVYASDYDAFLEPSTFKKPMHIKVFGYNLHEDILISGSLDLDLTGKFGLKVELFKDYRDDSKHTSSYLQINRRKLGARIKTKSQLVNAAKIVVSNRTSEIFKCPCIMGIEVEYQVAHRGFQRKWGAS